jgi:3-oxoacyl-[acyl-carrier protein] reductase
MTDWLVHGDELTGETAVVTGSSRGIGRAIALDLAAGGADVVVNYHSSEAEAHDVAAEIEAVGREALVAQADVSDVDSVRSMADTVHDAFGSVDILVNNAGINIDKRFGDLTPEDWRRVIEINLNGAYYCTEVFYDDLRAAPHGRVINISSVIGEMGNIGQANYAASKSGLFGLTRTLAKELAPTGTTANAVAPGFTETAMLEGVPDAVREQIREEIPVGRFATPEEVAAAVRFLAHERAAYVTGQVLDVNGGMHI